jgi:hypothetical protein
MLPLVNSACAAFCRILMPDLPHPHEQSLQHLGKLAPASAVGAAAFAPAQSHQPENCMSDKK